MSATHRWRGSELLARIERNVREAVRTSGLIVAQEVKLQLNKHKSPPASAPGSPPGKATGTLGRSVQMDLSRLKDANPAVLVGPGVLYARIHEFGGTIVGKKGMLAVPIGARGRAYAAAHGGGTGKLGAGVMGPERLVLIRRKGRPPILAIPGPSRGRGKGRQTGSFTPVFVLVPSVTLPARPYLRPGLRAARPRVLAQFSPDRLLR